MSGSITGYLHLSLRKGKNPYILWHLFLNFFPYIKWKLYKFFKGIHKPIVHYYALCWNEEKILPFVFAHYESFVDKFIFYDNGSTDNTQKLISSRSDTELLTYETEGFDEYDRRDLKNQCWKQSRGKADYVIVCDVDEFLYHPKMQAFLEDSLKKHLSYFHPHGYDMYSDSFPEYHPGEQLTTLVKDGIASDKYSKCIIFDPHKIVEINYSFGFHRAFPWGKVKEESSEKLKMLHYKNMGLDYIFQRILSYRERVTKRTLDNNCNHEYFEEDEKIKAEFCDNFIKVKSVL